jgi:hypothetical protein
MNSVMGYKSVIRILLLDDEPAVLEITSAFSNARKVYGQNNRLCEWGSDAPFPVSV